MIGTEKLSTIQRLLGQVPKAEIARRVGVSRRTVYEIAVGVKRRRAKQDPKEPYNYTRNRKGKCPICGYTVILPCVKCEPEAYALPEACELVED